MASSIYVRLNTWLFTLSEGVPCLVDDDRVIFESGAICQYLWERYDDGTFGRGLNHPECYEGLQWIYYAETLAVHGASLAQQTVFIAEGEHAPTVYKLETRRLERATEVLDKHLKDRVYLLASGFSAADTGVGYSVHLAKGSFHWSPLPGWR